MAARRRAGRATPRRTCSFDDGLGIGDLHFSDDDLYILAGPTIVMSGDIRALN